MRHLRLGIKEFFTFLKHNLRFFYVCFYTLSNFELKKIPFLCGKFLHYINVGMQSFFKNHAPYAFGNQGRFSAYSLKQLEQLKKSTAGLHSLIKDEQFSYSILVPVYKPNPYFFKMALQSALDQSAPSLEILVGFDGVQPAGVYKVIEELKHSHPRAQTCLRIFELDRIQLGSGTSDGGISVTTNALAAEATGNFLLLMDHDDWIRCDLLFRYEQTLRLAKNRRNLVLYCNEYKIDEDDLVIAGTALRKPEKPQFPYLFINYICHCLLVPKELWYKAGGLRKAFDGAQDYDLCLRLDLVGAEFQNVPLYLYAWRVHKESTAQNIGNKNYASLAGIKALQEYCKNKNLNWQIAEGYFGTSYKVITVDNGATNSRSNTSARPAIHIVVLYKDRKDMTIDCIKSLLKQKNVKLLITAVDNNSSDQSIKAELSALGIEVLSVQEPFNFSRLNNLGVSNSKHKDKSELILFINNDVVLDENALFEMQFWMQDPQIGVVGARLHYANDTLQHGGIYLAEGNSFHMNFSHTDWHTPFETAGMGRVIRTTEGVTGACLMIRKGLYHQIGGFDEIWYPIAFSDTDLCRKVRRKGYLILYTPYAFGYHFESETRGYNNIEDFDTSRWLFTYTEQREEGARFLPNTELDAIESYSKQ
jgi:GT2 family glycosyltransferase